MPARSSSLVQKIGASAVNCTLVLSISVPLYPLLGPELWKPITIATFLAYNLVFRSRCLGMRLVGTYIEQPTSILYASLYTLGYSTFFYSVVFPLDLLILNGIGQIISVLMTGNTLHANIARTATMSKDQYIDRAKQSALLLVEIGQLEGAVELMERAMNRYRDLRVWPEIVDAGKICAIEHNSAGVRDWINGF